MNDSPAGFTCTCRPHTNELRVGILCRMLDILVDGVGICEVVGDMARSLW
jgi:hypothetical protein